MSRSVLFSRSSRRLLSSWSPVITLAALAALCLAPHNVAAQDAASADAKYADGALYITAGRVKASARKSVSGYCALTSPIRASQNSNGLVCGLSTRKMRIPCWHQ
jgi:hypothetical protein